jgi:hypothetical protein
MSDVRLVDLDVIQRYSLAVRQDAAPAAELLTSLDASRAVVLAALAAEKKTPRKTAAGGRRRTPAPTTAAKRTGPKA